MTARILTPWFPAGVKPVHVGVYETKRDNCKFFSKWDGKKWLMDCRTPERAKAQSYGSEYQDRQWRGVLK